MVKQIGLDVSCAMYGTCVCCGLERTVPKGLDFSDFSLGIYGCG